MKRLILIYSLEAANFTINYKKASGGNFRRSITTGLIANLRGDTNEI